MKRFVVALLLTVGGIAAAHDGNAAHNRADDAIAKLTEALQEDPDDRRALMQRAFLYLKQDEYESALVDWEHLVRLDAKRDGFRFSRAYAHGKMSDYKAAFADLDALCSASTTVAGAWFYRGELRHELGDDRGAKSDLDRAVSITPKKYPHGLVTRAQVRAALGDKKGALADLADALDTDPRDLESRLERAQLLASDDWEGAKRELETAIEIANTDPRTLATQVLLQFGRNGLVDNETYARALDAYAREAKFSRSLHRKAALTLEAARLRATVGDVWPALQQIEEALQLAPERVDAHRLKVRLLATAKDAKPEVVERARLRLAEVEREHGVAAVTSR